MPSGLTRRRLLRVTAAGFGGLPAPSLAAPSAMLRPVELRCEHLVDPRGIDVPAPRLSWVCAATRDGFRDLRQSAYRILVASSPDPSREPDLWDSGMVCSPQSVLVPYGGRKLVSGQLCFWTVFIWDQEGERSAPVAPATWSMGLLDEQDWRGGWVGWDKEPAAMLLDANWIGYAQPGIAGKEANHVQYFRREFELPAAAAPGGGFIMVAADTDAVVFIDGQWVGATQGWDSAKRLDLPALRAGRHVAAIMVGRRDGASRPAALAARLEIDCVDGQALRIATDAAWQAADWVLPDWRQVDFDAATWEVAKVLAPVGATPWGRVAAPVVADGPAISLRRDVMLDRPVRRATAYLSGLGWSELWINARRVGDAVLSPGLADYSGRVPYVALEIAELLRPGANGLGVVLGNGRFRSPRPSARDFGSPRMRLQIEITFRDGTAARILGDETWLATDAGPIRRNNEYDGETYDARMDMPGWSEPGFDAKSWRPARAHAAPGGVMSATMAEPSRVLRVIQPARVIQSGPGARVFDFGQNIAGVCRLRAAGGRGAEIVVRHAESLRSDETLDVANLRGARATDRFVLDGGPRRAFQPRFTTHGFRFAELSGDEGATLEALEIADDLRVTGRFACSNPLLNRIHDAMAASVRANCRSIRTDCPQRDERQGWLGDPAGGWLGEAMMFGNAAFYAKWLTDITDTQRPDGSLSDVAPNYWEIYEDDVSWPSNLVSVAGMFLEQYADLAPMRRHLPAMVRWLDHMGSFLTGTVMPRDKYGDWGAPPEDRAATHPADASRQAPGTLIATAYFVRCLDLVARYAAILGHDPARYAEQAARIRAAFHGNFMNAATGRYGNGDATSTILALAFDLAPVEHRAAAGAHLLSTITAAGGHVCFGLIGAQWINQVLTALGRADVAYAMATTTTYPGFGYMIGRGATPLWELWNGDTADPAMNSRNHTMLMGDLPAWLYHHVAGLAPDPARPGFEHILIAPRPVGDLTWAEADYASPRGRVAVRWRVGAGRLNIVAEVPPNASATLTLPPGSHGDAWRIEHGRPAPVAGQSWPLGSGRHEFATDWSGAG